MAGVSRSFAFQDYEEIEALFSEYFLSEDRGESGMLGNNIKDFLNLILS
jgi:hypothetical protein